MPEISPKAVYATMQEDAKRGPLSKTLLVARGIAIVAAVGGAIPTAMTVYQSYAHGIPYTEVSHRLKQYDLWVRNFDCRIDYRALTTASGTRVDAGACGKTGDVAIKVTAQTGKAAYEWIAQEQLQKAGQVSLWDLFGGSAHAQGAPLPSSGATTAGGGGMKVLCQEMPSKGTLLRIVQDGPKCFRESVSLFKGSLDKREEVACTTTCKK